MRLRHSFLMLIVLLLTACGAGQSILENVPVSSPENTGTKVDVKGHLYALPKGYVRMTIERKRVGEMSVLTVTTVEPLLVADPKHIYRLRYDVNPNVSEVVRIEVDANGLLKKINVSSTDPLPATVRDLADFVVSASTGDFTPRAEAQPDPEPTKPDDSPFKVDAVFDPSADSPSSKALSDYLGKYGVELGVKQITPSSTAGFGAPPDCGSLVCYRFLLPWEISVTDTEAGMRTEIVVLLPNGAPVGGIDVRRLSLVKNTTALEFHNGILASAEYDNPSAVANMLQIPVNILKTIVSIPAALFQFTLKRETETAKLTAEKSLIQLQADLLQEKLRLLEKERDLDTAHEEPPG